MSVYDHEALSVDVGIRLRQLREERGLSLRALARKSGLSANALSMIERGKTSPSVSTLYKLANALQVPVTAFFQRQPERQEVVFVRRDERPRLPFARGLWEALGGDRYLGRMEPSILTLEVGGNSGPFPVTHTGHEFVFCLRGLLEYEVEGKRYLLQAGDALLFSARLHHSWRNAGHTVVSALVVLSGFAEEEHPSAMHFHAQGGQRDEGETPSPGGE